MRTLPIAVLLAAMLAIIVAGCSESTGRYWDRDSDEYRYRALRDCGDCRYRYWHDSRHREFFDPDDFGRGKDSLYGNPRSRHNEDYTRFQDDDCSRCRCGHHARGGHRWHGYSEDAVSDRYAPQMTPDSEYDE
ncbi:MAG TPA: hypothetical protein PK307_06115 [Spirochaetota bacterium]|nr:hypothetical protein [Spirochaetota bacterium]HOD13140.1 hypothetical protein [Spirochaetota bacterium]HPN10521.1 hypothetical protein [Spirochaetota bacterium]HQL81754.1 hypothetical protein [Spirochaetota bacterium]